MMGGGVKFSEKKHYEDVRFNVVRVGWGGQISSKKSVPLHLNGLFCRQMMIVVVGCSD